MAERKDKYAFFKKHAAGSGGGSGAAAGTSAQPQQQPSSQYAQQTPQHQQQPAAQPHLAQQVAPRNPFALPQQQQQQAVAQGPGALAAGSSGRSPPQLNLPTREAAAPPLSSSSSSARQLRHRVGSPTAADPLPASMAPAFPANVGPSPRAAASARGKVSAVNTPGGNNVVFELPRGQGGWSSASPQNVAAAAAAAAASSAQHATPAHATRETYGAGSYSSSHQSHHPQHSPPSSTHNPFANSGGGAHARGKRKHSDPDVAPVFGRKPASAKSSTWANLRSTLASPFLAVARVFKGADLKKDDDASSSRGPFASPRSIGNYKFGAAETELAPNMSTRIVRACTWKNFLFALVMSLLVTGFYLWYTHDPNCDDHDTIWTAPVLSAADRAHAAQPDAGGHMNEGLHVALNPASEPGGVVSRWMPQVASLQEFEQRYPFLHPVLHFFKRPTDHKGHKHAIAGSSSSLAVAAEIPFTLVSLLRDMTPEFLAENKASYIFQYNALLSWIRLTPHVIVYMDTQESCTKLTQRAEFRKVQCFPVPCMHDTVHRPLLNCIFEHSHETSTTEAMGFVNGDIILSPSVKPLISKISREFEKYLVVSRRTDTHLPEWLIDAYIANYHAQDRADRGGPAFSPATAVDPNDGTRTLVSDNVENAITYAKAHATLHSEFGIDLFLYPKSTFKWMFPAFPPFLAGVYRWDNYFLTKMILHPSVATIDASQFGLLIHQQVDGGKDHSKRTGAPINDALVKQHLGSVYKLGHIKNVDYVLNGDCVSSPLNCALAPNGNASVHVLYAKRANAQNWMAIIHVAAGEHVELNNFICWANRIGFRSFLFLTRDADMYSEIMARDMPVIFLDRTLVDQPIAGASPAAQEAQKYSDIESAASTLQRYDFLFSVLKAGYHFFYSSVRAVYLDDPLINMRSNTPAVEGVKPEPAPADIVYDVQLRGNSTHIFAPPFAGPIAVRSTNYGQYFWKQIHDCADMNKHIADPAQWIDCIGHNWRILKGGVKKGAFDEHFFTDAEGFFVEKNSLLNGYFPTMIDDESVRDNVDKFARLQQWGLLASHASSPVCKDDLPSHRASIFSPPTTKPEQDFRLKVRVLTFNRFASLKRLLDILQTAQYDNDQVDLEISIDYPLNMTDAPTIAEWTQTQLTARSFVWSHGKIEVIQQRTHIGLTGQWTQGWVPAEDNREIMLFLEDDTGVSPYYYTWCKRMIQTYYLNPDNYDPSLYGFALQTQHTILGETMKSMYGTRSVPSLLNDTAIRRGLEGIDREYFRYQLVGTWGGVFFPQHWREFLIWLREKQFIHAQGTSPIFQPCVPTMVSNAWWAKKPHKVWSQWFVRFAFEKGWYNLYTNFPDQLSLVGNFREGGENFAITKGLMNDMVDQFNSPPGSPLYERIHTTPLPVPVSRIPLYDLHFNEVQHSDTLKTRLAVWGNPSTIPQCLTIAELKKARKAAAEKLKAKTERHKREAEQRARDGREDADGAPTPILSKLESTMQALAAKDAVPKDAATDAKKASAAAAAAKKKADAAKKGGKDAKKSGDKKDAGKKKDSKAAADKSKSKDGKKADAKAKKPAADKKAANAKKKADAAKKKAAAKPAEETTTEESAPATEEAAAPATEEAATTEKPAEEL